MGAVQGGGIKDCVVIKLAAQGSEQLTQIGLREGIAEAVGKGQQPSAVLEEPLDRAHLFTGEKRLALPAPALPPSVIVAGRRWDNEQLGVR